MQYNILGNEKYAAVRKKLRDELEDEVKYLEKRRSKLNKLPPTLSFILYFGSKIIFTLSIIFAWIETIYLLGVHVHPGLAILVFIFVPYIGIFLYLKHSAEFKPSKYYRYKDYKSEYKTMLIKKLIPVYFESMQYVPEKYISEKLFLQAEIDNTKPIKFKGEDLFKGDINGIPMAFSEISTKGFLGKKKGLGLLYGAHTGVLFIIKYPIPFKTKTLVLPEYDEHNYGDFGYKVQKRKYKDKLVHLEDPRFEKLFMVIAEDQVEARYILNPSMMEYLCELQEKTKMELAFSFANSKLFISLPAERNIFNPDINVHIKESVAHTFQYIGVIATIAEDIYKMHQSMKNN